MQSIDFFSKEKIGGHINLFFTLGFLLWIFSPFIQKYEVSQGVNLFCSGKSNLMIKMLSSVVMTLNRLAVISFYPFIPSQLFTMHEINNETLCQPN